MTSRRSLALLMVCLGCGNTSTLGRLSDEADGGADAVVDAPAIDAPPADPCVPAGTRFGRSAEIVQSAARYTARILSTAPLRSGTDLRVGTATVQGTSVVWSVSDDRCGVRAGDRWWGVQLGRLTREPDRPGVTWHFDCLSATWAGLLGHPFVTPAALGVVMQEHPILMGRQPNQYWREGKFILGAVVDDPPAFAPMFDPDGLQSTVRFTTRAEGIDLLYRLRGGGRTFTRLDATLNPAVEPVVLHPEGEALNFAETGPTPWRDGHYLGAWWPSGDFAGGDRFEVFTADGEVLERWRLDERVGLTDARLSTRWMAATACGVEFVANVGGEDSVSASYTGRLWYDGRWSLRPLAGAMVTDHVASFGPIRLVTALAPDRSSLSLVGFDDAGDIVLGPTIIERSRELLAGDVVVVPGHDEVMVLYSSRISQTAPVLAKAALVAIDRAP